MLPLAHNAIVYCSLCFLSVSLVSGTSHDFKTAPGPPPQSRDSPAGMAQGIALQGSLAGTQQGRNFWKLHKAVCFRPLRKAPGCALWAYFLDFFFFWPLTHRGNPNPLYLCGLGFHLFTPLPAALDLLPEVTFHVARAVGTDPEGGMSRGPGGEFQSLKRGKALESRLGFHLGSDLEIGVIRG